MISRSRPAPLTCGAGRLVLATFTLAMLLTGCGGPPPGGDPGGRRLKELAADRVLSARPSGSSLVSVVRTKAKYTEPGFEGGGWRGPSVMVTIRSREPAIDVLRFYGTRAVAAGWTPLAAGSLGVTDGWKKTYPDGALATLLVSPLPQPSGTIVLSAGIAPALH